MKILIVLGVLALICSAVCAYLVLSLPAEIDNAPYIADVIAQAEKKLAALTAKGLEPGDPEYDDVADQVARTLDHIGRLSRSTQDNHAQRVLIRNGSIASGVLGALLIWIGWQRKRKLARRGS